MALIKLRTSLLIGVVVMTSVISMTFACSAKNNGYGWGEPNALVIPKPTLIPKLAAAFQDGKASVQPYKHGKLLVHSGWGKGIGQSHQFNSLGQGYGNNYEYGYGVNAPYTHDVKIAYEKGGNHGAKGHYVVKEPNSFKSVNYDTVGFAVNPEIPYGGEAFGDYAAGFAKK